MADDEFRKQSYDYNSGYSELGSLANGFPDLKIVDYNQNVQNKRVLSIGGGNGADVVFLADKNEVHLVDGSAVAVKQALGSGIKAQVADVSQKLAFTDNYFDIVILKDILEHIYNPLDLLLEAKRVLKNEGYAIISVPNHFYLPFRLRILFGGNMIWKSLMHNHKKYFEEWNYMHIRFFTWGGFNQLLQNVGFKIAKGYWDFGALAHYSDPLMYEYAFRLNNKKITSSRQRLLYKVFLPLYKVFNILFSKKVRAWLVSLSPGLLCAGFYVKVKKI